MTIQGELFDNDLPPWEMDSHHEVNAAFIALTEPPFGPFHYRVPKDLDGLLTAGMRVRVPLGKSNRLVDGYCIAVETLRQSPDAFKPISECLDEHALCNGKLIELIQWMAKYYIVPIGQLFEAVIPAGVRSSAGTRIKKMVSLTSKASNDEEVSKLPQKQRQIVRQLILADGAMAIDDLLKLVSTSASPVHTLTKNGFLKTDQQRVLAGDSVSMISGKRSHAKSLSVDQRLALAEIIKALESLKTETILLHGITGSGKTEIYMQAIERVVQFGRQAIVLVPEIALTPQTRNQFKDRFGDVALLHSQMTDAQRHFQWRRISDGEVSVIIGARSAIFAPAPNLGLIILDEEHESSFKQDSIPRYHARDVALQRAKLEQIPLLLGSATPSLETWQRAVKGIYQRVSLPRRIHNRPLPLVHIHDMRSDRFASTQGSISENLLREMRSTTQQGGQTILLLNRRGFSTNIQCLACGHVVACPDCDLPLTHHRDGGKAMCHYCDYTIPTPPCCPICRADGIRFSGIGTQRLEHEVKQLMPDAKVARMDSDTMRRPGSHERTLSQFREGEIQILLGTQMIAKGLDFPNVLLVGVVNADMALHFPDFRATERTFQLITQVAGRTGRGDKPGLVIVQTYSPEHPCIELASKHDYLGFAASELGHREKFGYPPYGSMARIIIRGPVEKSTETFADGFAKQLEKHQSKLGTKVRVLGPAIPPIARLRGLYRYHLMLSASEAIDINTLLSRTVSDISPPKEIQFVIDIDPIDML